MEVDEVDSVVSYEAPPIGNAHLVEPRDATDRSVVSTRSTDKATPDDLVALASQLTMARELVKGRACDRLRGIAQQMEQLQLKVLEDAARDEDLHSVACNMQKQPGRVYHLYRRLDGYRYFSLLAPHEWGNEEKEGEFVGSFRLEFDRSWTDMTEAAEKDRQFAQFQNMLKAGPAMLGWRN